MIIKYIDDTYRLKVIDTSYLEKRFMYASDLSILKDLLIDYIGQPYTIDYIFYLCRHKHNFCTLDIRKVYKEIS